MQKRSCAGARLIIDALARILQRLRMDDQDNKTAELGPIARELIKLAEELRELADTPLFTPEDVANDDNVQTAERKLLDL